MMRTLVNSVLDMRLPPLRAGPPVRPGRAGVEPPQDLDALVRFLERRPVAAALQHLDPAARDLPAHGAHRMGRRHAVLVAGHQYGRTGDRRRIGGGGPRPPRTRAPRPPRAAP